MPRHPRVHAEGLLYHVKARGNDGQKIFLSQSDYQALIEASDRASSSGQDVNGSSPLLLKTLGQKAKSGLAPISAAFFPTGTKEIDPRIGAVPVAWCWNRSIARRRAVSRARFGQEGECGNPVRRRDLGREQRYGRRRESSRDGERSPEWCALWRDGQAPDGSIVR